MNSCPQRRPGFMLAAPLGLVFSFFLWGLAAQVVQTGARERGEEQGLERFLPDDEGKALVLLYCTGCHSGTDTRQRIADRKGGDRDYWERLVRRMMTVWNAPIAEEDVPPITGYLAKHFGPAPAHPQENSSGKENSKSSESKGGDDLASFLPDDDGKPLVLLYCTGCHSGADTRQRIADRKGGDRDFWERLVRRMMTVWNAPIAEEDVAPIAGYLAKHFGPAGESRD